MPQLRVQLLCNDMHSVWLRHTEYIPGCRWHKCAKQPNNVCLTATLRAAAEKQVLRDQANSQAKGGKPKPANIIEKIISGRVNKVLEVAYAQSVIYNLECRLP